MIENNKKNLCEKNQPKSFLEESDNPFSEPVEIEITDTIDLHGFAPKDIKSVVKTYLQEAHARGFKIVRIIHGKGIGVQREIVRKILKETDFVESFKTADEFGGGAGATIAFLKK
ncbi:MAG: DNA mismatch repair protein MutS [Acidobacteria bacterium]|jgi:dsDNA-specific endonuclease/ATPase MutS2|nr:MAG: DNA mismatch repair protein MutS [Acidobacteriota bacterium]GIU82085.1 MAG: hypothetical protein KatS3mg006_1149 [Pyrinomonadaceae bacterium]